MLSFQILSGGLFVTIILVIVVYLAVKISGNQDTLEMTQDIIGQHTTAKHGELMKVINHVDLNDAGLMNNHVVLEKKVSEIQNKVMDLQLNIQRANERVNSMKIELDSIPKIREDLPHVDNKQQLDVMFSDHFVLEKDGVLMFYRSKGVIALESEFSAAGDGTGGSGTTLEPFVGQINIDYNEKCTDIDTRGENKVLCGYCDKFPKHCVNDSMAPVWINTNPFKTKFDADFAKQCILNEKDAESSSTGLNPECVIFDDVHLLKRISNSYYALKNMIDTMTLEQFEGLMPAEEISYINNNYDILIEDGQPISVYDNFVKQRYLIGLQQAINLPKGILILAYHYKKIGKSLPQLLIT